MLSGLMGYFGGRRDPKQTAREAIITLRQQLQMIEKKEEYLQTKIEEEERKAKVNAVSNRNVAMAALRRKKAASEELDRLAGTRLQLEMQVNTLESANMNAETMAAMSKATSALGDIHRGWNIDKVDATMAAVNEQRELANEIAEAISHTGGEIDEEELKAELADLEQEELNERLMGADHVPVHLPTGASRVEESRHRTAEADEAAELRELQASLAM